MQVARKRKPHPLSDSLLGEGEGEGVRAMAVVVVTSLQAEAPAAEYFPAAQAMQKLIEVAPVTTEYLPAGQSVHALAPEEVVYLPASHRGLSASVAAFSAYTLLSKEPTKMLAPSGLTAGDEYTRPPVANAHLSSPGANAAACPTAATAARTHAMDVLWTMGVAR
jgi:hypothetical protein